MIYRGLLVVLVCATIGFGGSDKADALLNAPLIAITTENGIMSLRAWNLGIPLDKSPSLIDVPLEPNFSVFTTALDAANKRLYVTEADLENGSFMPGKKSIVVQIDLSTGQKKIMITGESLFSSIPFPDSKRAFVMYAPALRAPPQILCTLDIESGQCVAPKCSYGNWDSSCQKLQYTPLFFEAFWSGLHEIVFNEIGTLYTFDVDTLTAKAIQVLEGWQIQHISLIPKTRTILIDAYQLDIEPLAMPDVLMTYNLDTKQLSKLSYGIVNKIYNLPDYVLLSPDGRLLTYCKLGRCALLNFQTGRLIGEANDVLGIEWLSNSQGILLTANHETGDLFFWNGVDGKQVKLNKPSLPFVIVH